MYTFLAKDLLAYPTEVSLPHLLSFGVRLTSTEPALSPPTTNSVFAHDSSRHSWTTSSRYGHGDHALRRRARPCSEELQVAAGPAAIHARFLLLPGADGLEPNCQDA